MKKKKEIGDRRCAKNYVIWKWSTHTHVRKVLILSFSGKSATGNDGVSEAGVQSRQGTQRSVNISHHFHS